MLQHPSKKPAMALYPDEGTRSWNLWQLVHARTGATKADYLKAFHRYCLGEYKGMWNEGQARQHWKELEADLLLNFDRIVIVGTAVRRAAGLGVFGDLYISNSLICIPAPSSNNYWYDDPVHRGAMEVLFEELFWEATIGVAEE